MMSDGKRFEYYRNSQMILDDLTGYTYNGNKKVCNLLNQISDKSDSIAEELFDRELEYEKLLDDYHKIQVNYEICRKKVKAYQEVLEKHHIISTDRLDQVLEELL